MRVGSLFSGVGGFDLGLERAGHEIVWQVENDKQCRSVLRHHWPNVDIYEDVQDVGFDKGRPSAAADSRDRRGDAHSGSGGGEGSQRAIHSAGSVKGEAGRGRTTLAPVDIICGGFPCQDLSVAGGRKGLAGERSGLWGEFHRIIGELSPTWILIENVAGLLSSNEGRDMAVIVHGLEELGYGWSYRILDSQYFGVPQRRRRVFIVGHSGGVCRPEILLESESLCGNIEEVGEAGEEVAGTSRESSEGSGVHAVMKAHGFGKYTEEEHTGPLKAVGQDNADADLVLAHGQGGAELTVNKSPTLSLIHEAPVVFRKAQKAQKAQFIVGAIQQVQRASGGGKVLNDSAQTLRSGAEHNYQFLNTAIPRRLTPTECERLQGFPDGWTGIDGMADSPRYSMMGNAVTVNVAEWIARRLPSEEG